MTDAYQLLAAALAFPILFSVVWLLKNKKRGLISQFNLRFRRARTVKVNLHTISGRNIECFPTVDSRGFVKVEGGMYRVLKEFSTINAKWKIPEYDIIEAQIVPPNTTFGKIDGKEITIEVADEASGTVQTKTEKVPTYVVSHYHTVPRPLEGKMAQEVHDMMDSKIIADIDASSDAVMNDIKLVKILTFCILAAVLLGGILIYQKISSTHDLIVAVRAAAGK